MAERGLWCLLGEGDCLYGSFSWTVYQSLMLAFHLLSACVSSRCHLSPYSQKHSAGTLHGVGVMSELRECRLHGPNEQISEVSIP